MLDPLNGEEFLEVPNVQSKDDYAEIVQSTKQCKKSGLHNPFKNIERYNMLGNVCHRAATLLHDTRV